jgi:hypothetical protein
MGMVFLGTGTVQAVEEISVFAGVEGRVNCPVVVDLPAGTTLSGEELKLVGENMEIPVTVIQQGNETQQLAFIISEMKPYEKQTFKLESGAAQQQQKVTIQDTGSALEFSINGQPFTTYHYETSDKVPRPIFYPVLGPGGIRMTRGYPMDPQEGDAKDHPHHQSLWVSHGAVNHADFWLIEKNMGYQRHKSFETVQDGDVCAQFVESIEWVDNAQKPVMSEVRKVTIWALPENARAIDFEITFIPNYGDVTFGDTKEGGLISLRVASSMQENTPEKKKGGTIFNANEQEGEKNAWGKAAAWCDYYGPVGGITAGFTIMDHPENLFFPTNYHVRSYGLFTANPFGLSDFMRDENVDGSRILKEGETWNLKYRVYLHEGDTKAGNVESMYSNFVDMPQVFFAK